MDPVHDEEPLLRGVLSERLKLIAYIRSIVRRADLAEDVFQDLCVLALQKRSEITDTRNLPAWLRTSARHLALNAIRKHSNRDVLLGDRIFDLMEPHWGQLDGAAGTPMAEALNACLDRLSPVARQILRDRYQEGLSGEELARRMGRSVGGLYTTISRIHKRLAECVLRKTAQAGGHSARA